MSLLFLSYKKGLPPGYLIYLRAPNFGSNYILPATGEDGYAELYALLGPGFWFDADGNPIPRGGSEIAECVGINQWNIWFNARIGLVIYLDTILFRIAYRVGRIYGITLVQDLLPDGSFLTFGGAFLTFGGALIEV